MLEVKRKEKETTGAFVRRFSRRVQESGVLLEARKTRYFSKPPTKRARKQSALRRLKISKEFLRLKKLGKTKSSM